MSRYKLSRKAYEDIESFRTYLISENGETVSKAFLQSTYLKFKHLGEFPGMGRKRDDIATGLFSFPDIQYRRIIFYRKFSNHIRIIRVLGGVQDHKQHFRG